MPECSHTDNANDLYIHSRCHPTAPTWAVFEKETATMRIECDECGTLVIRVGLEKPPAN